ncbi:MAG: guanine deaminase, partial [Candidatus Cloacimonetes bacterium HGW-Cloacimonetes-1]
MRKIKTNLITPIDSAKTTYLNDVVIAIEAGIIVSIEPFDASIHNEYEDKTAFACLPGLIDMHVHLSQFDIRGQYRPALLPWLNDVVFPAENKSTNPEYAASIAERFFSALFKAGTTTAIIYTAPSYTA